uniref:MADF domain-containing protein n=1 Tax=Heliothis virescens TaxID=7102 RepID=A0A2A4K6C9_HELVI
MCEILRETAILKPDSSSLETSIMSDSDTSSSMQRFSKKMIPTRELIAQVRQRRCLWDRCHASYRDKTFKDNSWHEIYLAFEPAYDSLNDTKKNLIGNIITRKWYNVRDSYVKSRKPGVRRPYLYAEEMQFLDPIYLLDRKGNDKSFIEERISNDDEADADAEADNTHSWLQEVFVDIEEGDGDTQPPPDCPPKRAKLDFSKEEGGADESIISVLAGLIQKEEDEDRAFFKSITPSVKKLSDTAKFEFRIQVMKLIHSLKIRDRDVVKLKRERSSNVDSDSD